MGKTYRKLKVKRHSTTAYRNKKKSEIKRSVFKTNKEATLIMFYDVIEGHPFTIPYWSIMEFNGKKVTYEYGK